MLCIHVAILLFSSGSCSPSREKLDAYKLLEQLSDVKCDVSNLLINLFIVGISMPPINAQERTDLRDTKLQWLVYPVKSPRAAPAKRRRLFHFSSYIHSSVKERGDIFIVQTMHAKTISLSLSLSSNAEVHGLLIVMWLFKFREISVSLARSRLKSGLSFCLMLC